MGRPQPKHSRLGTQRRSQLAELYGQRGHANSHLWYFYSPKAQRDAAVPSDLQYGHVLLVESDPHIKTVNYNPPYRKASECEGAVATRFDAEATCFDGSIELHEVKPSSALQLGADERAAAQLRIQSAIERIEREKGRKCRHIVFTEETIFANPIRIRNWFEALPWIAQARYYSLYEPGMQVAALLHADQRVSLGELLQAGGPLYLAAALHGVAHGTYGSDLDEVVLNTRTVFFENAHKRRFKVERSHDSRQSADPPAAVK